MSHCHHHLILNAVVENDHTSVQTCRDWLNALVPKIHMNILVPANCIRCDDPGNEGITGTVVISTSHAAFHYWSPDSACPSRLSFCLYSCAPFDPDVVYAHVDEFWGIQSSRLKVFDRNWDILEITEPAALALAS